MNIFCISLQKKKITFQRVFFHFLMFHVIRLVLLFYIYSILPVCAFTTKLFSNIYRLSLWVVHTHTHQKLLCHKQQQKQFDYKAAGHTTYLHIFFVCVCVCVVIVPSSIYSRDLDNYTHKTLLLNPVSCWYFCLCFWSNITFHRRHSLLLYILFLNISLKLGYTIYTIST